MWTIASTSAMLTSMFADIGTVLGIVITAVLSTAIALVGLGFGWRHLKKYVTGKKF
jgi:hypothetical protein